MITLIANNTLHKDSVRDRIKDKQNVINDPKQTSFREVKLLYLW
jgi:hypothetical protein